MKTIKNVMSGVAFVCFVGIILLTLFQIFFRTVLKISVPWTEEINRLIFIYLVYFGAGVAVLKGEMIAVDTVLKALTGKIKRVILKVINILNLLFTAVMLISSIQMLEIAWPTTFSTVTWLSNGFLYFPLIISFSIMFIAFTRRLFVKAEE